MLTFLRSSVGTSSQKSQLRPILGRVCSGTPKSSGRARADLAGTEPLCGLEGVLCKGKWGGIEPGSLCVLCIL